MEILIIIIALACLPMAFSVLLWLLLFTVRVIGRSDRSDTEGDARKQKSLSAFCGEQEMRCGHFNF